MNCMAKKLQFRVCQICQCQISSVLFCRRACILLNVCISPSLPYSQKLQCRPTASYCLYMDMATDLHCHPHHPHFLCSVFIGPAPSSPPPLSLGWLKYEDVIHYTQKNKMMIKQTHGQILDNIEVYCNEKEMQIYTFVK